MKEEKLSHELAIAASQSIEEENYWLDKLSGNLPRSFFPCDNNKRAKHDRSMKNLGSMFPGELSARLAKISNNSDARMFIVMATALVILLNKYTHNDDITVGTSIYKQEVDVQFINTLLPLRTEVKTAASFKDILMQISKVVFDANKHQNYPIERLLHLLDMTLVEGEDFPLFDVAVLLDNIHDKKYLRDIHLKMIFIFSRTDEGMEIMVEFNSLIYNMPTIERIITHFMNLLEQTAFNVDIEVARINILSRQEREDILFSFNNTMAEYSRDKTVHQLFEEQVEKTPTNIAVTFDGKILSYKDLNQRANKLAYQLRKKGVRPNGFVAITIERSLEMIIGVMAILKSGGAYVPLETYLPEARLITCLASLNVECLLTNHTQLSKIHRVSKELPALKHIFCLDEVNEATVLVGLFNDKICIPKGEVDSGPAENPAPTAAASDIAYVIFTSGTTGTPKGVVEKHRPVINIIEWVNMTFEVADPDKLLFVVSLSFDLSVYDIFGILASGASMRIVGSDDLKLPDRILDIIYEEGITFWDSAPAALQMLVPYLDDLKKNRYCGNKSKLRLVFLSGDWIPVTIPDILKEAFEGVRVISLGGATEATIWSNYYPVEQVAPEWNSIPYGKPIWNAKYYILNSVLNPCPIGVSGDLYIGGECLASGYINDEVLTAKKFIDNPFEPGEKMYRTGDLARWFPDGNMEFLGRQDNQVKIRGFRIELGEIESQLLMHTDIEAAVVLVWGEPRGDRYLCAYYVSDRVFSSTELSEYLAEILPDYMVPAFFVRLDKLPLTENGKINRKAFPEPQLGVPEEMYVAPGDKTEELVVEIWSELLGLDKEKISINSDFFELGGHSLNATRMAAKIHKSLNVKIPLAEIFKFPTVKRLAEYVKSAKMDRYKSIEPAEEKEFYPLSSAQKRLFIVQQMEENSTAYNMLYILPFEETFIKDKLEATFKALIARHESLRTSFEIISGQPVQRIRKEVDFAIDYYDTVEDQLNSVIRGFTRVFDLSCAPLLRVGIVRVEGSRHILLLDMHHIITDENSQNVLAREFMALYNGEELPPPRLQYKDFSAWQNGETQQSAVKKQGIYWLQEFEGEVPVLNLPTDFTRPSAQSFEGNTVSFWLSKREGRTLSGVAREEGKTVFMVLLAVYYILLSKVSCQEEIIIGVPIGGRKHDDLEQTIGMFINTLALRNYPGGNKTFREFLNEVRIKLLEAFENQEYPFEDLVENVYRHRDTSRNPLFDVMLNLLNGDNYTGNISEDTDTEADDARDSETYSYAHRKRVSRFDMAFLGVEVGETIFFDLIYCSELFKPETIDRFIYYFKKLIRALRDNLDRKISDIDILSETEKNRLLYQFNSSQADYLKDKTIIEIFEAQVEKSPGTIALVFEDHQISYRKLNQQANQLGWLLRSKGVKPDTLVSLMVQRSAEMVVGICGILKSGSAYLPVNPEAPEDRITYMLDNASVNILLTQEKFIEKFANRYQVINLNSPASYENPCANPECKNIPTDLAYVIYTSGSTGKPKGVMIQNRSVINIVKWFAGQYHMKPGFQLLQMFEYTFDASINQIFGSLLHGVTLHVIRKEYFYDIEFLRDYIISHFINLINFVQSVIREVLCGKEKIESLKYVISGAEKLKSTIKNEILDNAYALYNQYGPTEVTVDALAEKCSYESNGTVGGPVYNAQCYIVNKYGQINPLGVAGELWVSGDGLARGYINNVALTAEKFILNPFNRGTNVYRTGDLTRWLPSGNVEFLGRIDTQVKIRGFRIEPVEIANQLVKIDGIKEAVVIDREDSSGETYLCAYLVGEEETDEIVNSEIKKILSRSLPDYMIPSYFTWIERLPLSGHGKLIRSALPEPEIAVTESYVPPSNHLERKLVEIWSEILEIDTQVIGVNTDFIELGGHSLKATILAAKIHKELKVKVPLIEIFKRQSIKQLSNYIEGSLVVKYEGINSSEDKEYYVLSQAQKRLYILQQLVADNIGYNMPYVIAFREHIEKEKLESVFKELIKRHESLRTCFITANEEPVQKITKEVTFSIRYSNASEVEIKHIISNFVVPFNLSKAPLLRVELLTVESTRQILLIDMHHIITDGISQSILEKEFMALYSGEELPPLRLQYKDYSEWQNSEQQKLVTKEQERYWLEMFADEVPILNLPTDYPRPIIQSFAGNQVDFLLTVEENRILKELVKQTGATVYMCILSVFTILLSRLSGQEDIVVGMPIAARRHADLEKIIGMFVNTLAMRNTPCGEKRFSEFLTELKERTLKAYENQEYQFEELVDKLSVTRDTGRNPVFNVVFNLLYKEENNDYIPGPQEKDQYHYIHREGTSKFDLALTAVDRGNECLFNIEYCTRLFKSETIDRFISYFKRILDSLSEDWEKKLSELDIITEEEKNRILYEFNNTELKYPNNKTIHQLFEEQVGETPNNIALIGPSLAGVNIQLSYRELDEKSNRLAHVLQTKGVGLDTIVGIILERSVEMIVGIMGILKSGGAYLPIEPEYPQDRIDYMLKDSGASILIKKSEIRNSKFETNPDGQKINDQNKDFEDLMILDFEHLDFEFVSDFDIRASNLNASNIAYIIYTSGSTGRPKGVMVEHRNVVRLVKNAGYIQYSMQDRLLPTGSAAFDISTFEIWSPLLNSFTLLLVSKEIILNPEMLKEVLLKYDISILHLIPQLFNQMAEQEIELFSRLRYFLVGGDLVKPGAVNKLHNTYPHLKIVQCYGPTENTTFSTTFRVDKNYDLRIPIGKPIGNSYAFIVDKYDHLQPVGVPGELLVGGDGIALGYLNKPELTAEKFIDFHHSSFIIHHSKLYRTGDLVCRLPDGNIEFLGRIDQQIKIRGFRIELGEIDKRLAEHHGVKAAVTICRIDDKGDKYLCAYIIPETELEVSDLREYLAKSLPDYMIPSYFVPVEKIPLTPNGKLDRKALPEPKMEVDREYEPPRDKVEEKLVEIWAELLGIEKDIIGINSNFFQLGGHSLKATILTAKIQKNFNVHISLIELFKTPTIKNIASLIKIVSWEDNKKIDSHQKMEEITI
ncbi:MAG: hypothetical protein QG657_965 [Acidobacteriota bacterium]|nr:hypothetical protein [Acidobacteriota bacterium]